MDKTALKEKIIARTSYLIRKKGGDDFTVDEIAADAGISKRTFYEVIESKEMLIEECYARISGDLMRTADEILAENMSHPLRCLVSLADTFLRVPYLKSGYEHGRNIDRIKEKTMAYWQVSFRSVINESRDDFIGRTPDEELIRFYFDFLEFLRRKNMPGNNDSKASYIFLRGMLNEKGTRQFDSLQASACIF